MDGHSQHLACAPCFIVAGKHALWRTQAINFVVRRDHQGRPGELQHLGREDDDAILWSSDTDVNNILQERFSCQQQIGEAPGIWPNVEIRPTNTN